MSRECRGCGRPLFDDDHRVKYCEACRDRVSLYAEEDANARDGGQYATEEAARIRRDRPRGYA